MVKQKEFIFYWKLLNKVTPPYFTSFKPQWQNEIHSHNTRHSNQPARIFHYQNYLSKTLRYRLINRIIYSPPLLVDNIDHLSIASYKNLLKKTFINEYESYCKIIGCYICNKYKSWLCCSCESYIYHLPNPPLSAGGLPRGIVLCFRSWAWPHLSFFSFSSPSLPFFPPAAATSHTVPFICRNSPTNIF